MSTSPAVLRMVEVSGAEARLVYTQRELTVVRPGRHAWEFGRLVVRTPAPAAAVPATVTYHVDEVRAATGTGWSVTVAGPAEVITDPDEAAHYRRTLTGWTHGPHDTLLHIHPKTLTGYRLARAEA